jgi:transcriptional regulator with XRE-family HTH domain
MKTIIDQLRDHVDKSPQSQLAIAKATGIGQPNLNRFMRNERGLSLENVEKLAAYLKLKLVRR